MIGRSVRRTRWRGVLRAWMVPGSDQTSPVDPNDIISTLVRPEPSFAERDAEATAAYLRG